MIIETPLEGNFQLSLSQALHAARKQQQVLQSRIEDLNNRIDHIRQALDEDDLGEYERTLAAVPPTASVPLLKITPERLEKIRSHLREVGECRQVDISSQTGENSGTVSVALRILENNGEAIRGEVQNKSRRWRLADHSEAARTEERIAA